MTDPVQALVSDPQNLVTEALSALSNSQDLTYLNNLQDTEIANLIESVNLSQRISIIEALPAERYWPIARLLQYDTAKHLHRSLSESVLNDRMSFVTESDIINYVGFLSESFVDEFLLSQSADTATHLQQVLSYDDNKVGRYTEPCFIVANIQNSAGLIKKKLSEKGDNQIQVVIVRDQKQVIGIVSPSVLMLSEDNLRLREMMTQTPIVNDNDNIYDIGIQLPIDGSSQWFPVMAEGKILGVLSLVSIISALREQSLQAVVQENVRSEEDLFTPLHVAARLRALWLIINLATAFAASAIIGIFDKAVEQVVALAILMPVVASMGGIAGSQTLAVALRGIALNHLHTGNIRLLVKKELKIAAFNGVIMGAAIGIIVYMVFHSALLSIIIFIAISLNSLAAAASGTLIPFTLTKLKIDPAVAGSVVLTTVTDIVGFFVFLGLGALLLL
ncbi:magnesium transporter [Vibrio zhanjiangensis]|uniref:Magnesium transporter n=1 Tax=Vibrio zhanjiangensis TaxID=1046128 RepID=A0ABQ6EVF5_9VIBR|nr:magnesium transporter [Vibrio zhanjiangensis]GLT16997.1 magnesium transporter [Vibrio zhanjiangensis]